VLDYPHQHYIAEESVRYTMNTIIFPMATAGEFEFKILNVEVVFKLCSNAADNSQLLLTN